MPSVALVVGCVAVLACGASAAFDPFAAFSSLRDRPVRFGDDTLTNRSMVNVLFNRFLLNAMTGDYDSMATIIDPEVVWYIGGSYSCDFHFNQSMFIAAMKQVLGPMRVIGLQAGYHIVSEDSGAFAVQDFGLPGESPYFIDDVVWYVHINAAKTRIDALYGFYPTQPTAQSEKSSPRCAV